MKAMVLAAGMGTRMRHLTADRPKPMVPVLGRPLIDRTLERLDEIGVGEAVVNLHYQPEMLRAHLAGREAPGVVFSDETGLLLETGGGVAKALPMLGDGPFIVVNSDNVWIGEDAFAPLIRAWDAGAMDALLMLVPVERAVGYSRAGDFFLGEGTPCPGLDPAPLATASDGPPLEQAPDQVRGRGSLIRRGDAPTAPYVFTGAQILSPTLFHDVPEGPFSLNLVWDRAIAAGRAFGIVHPGAWCDVGTPEGLAEAEEALG